MVDRAILLKRLEAEQADPMVNRLKAWLDRQDTYPLSSKVGKVTVSEALRLWRTRVEVSSMTGHRLEGADDFIRRLEGLTPQRQLEQFAFNGSESSGSLFFLVSSHSFVGAVLVRT